MNKMSLKLNGCSTMMKQKVFEECSTIRFGKLFCLTMRRVIVKNVNNINQHLLSQRGNVKKEAKKPINLNTCRTYKC